MLRAMSPRGNLQQERGVVCFFGIKKLDGLRGRSHFRCRRAHHRVLDMYPMSKTRNLLLVVSWFFLWHISQSKQKSNPHTHCWFEQDEFEADLK
jgi:hypothetical protein